MADRLRGLWDFGDLDGTERRFRAQLEEETSDAAQAEVLTQLARVEGLRGAFAEGARLLEEAETHAGTTAIARARIDLERGRVLRSSGDPAAAFPLFESAFATAVEAGDEFVAVDAAHMAAIAAPDHETVVEWTRRGIDRANASADARYWVGPLLNNLGWAEYERGDHAAALEAFEGALRARELDTERAQEREIARYAVAKTLLALGRPGDAAALLEQSVAWTESVDEPDGYFHEELAEAYAALGRDGDAREQAALALSLLPDAGGEQLARLRGLVARG